MNIETNGNIININSPIVSINDIEEISSILNSMSNYKNIIININNSFSLPSTIIGELELLKEKGVDITINIEDETLQELFIDLGLNKIFKINLRH